MSWWLVDRGQISTGKASAGQAAKQPDPPSWECNAGVTKIKAQEGKGEPDARLCVLDTVDCHAQDPRIIAAVERDRKYVASVVREEAVNTK